MAYQRLRSHHDYQLVFNARQRRHGQGFALHWRINGLPYARMGVITSKRAARRAVDRNRIRRIVKESFRHSPNPMVGFDLVVVAHHDILKRERTAWRANIDELFSWLSKRSVKR